MLALATWLPACGGGGSDSPEAKCEAVFDLACERVGECMVGGLTEAQCHEALDPMVDCGAVDRVGDSYDECIDLMESLACAELFPGDQVALPAECMGVLIIE